MRTPDVIQNMLSSNSYAPIQPRFNDQERICPDDYLGREPEDRQSVILPGPLHRALY